MVAGRFRPWVLLCCGFDLNLALSVNLIHSLLLVSTKPQIPPFPPFLFGFDQDKAHPLVSTWFRPTPFLPIPSQVGILLQNDIQHGRRIASWWTVPPGIIGMELVIMDVLQGTSKFGEINGNEHCCCCQKWTLLLLLIHSCDIYCTFTACYDTHEHC